jgi:CRISPR system Cascade subunit CasC
MSTFVEIHLIQNFAPSCLNRDDTGAPKDAMFGGCRRSRISSQCLKRAIRETFTVASLLKPEELAIRTRNLVAILEQKLADQGITSATAAIENALAIIELKVKARSERSSHTEYLLFLSNNAIDELAKVIISHLNTLQTGKGDRAAK